MTTVLSKLDSVNLSQRIWIKNARRWPQCASHTSMLLDYPDTDGDGKRSRCEDNVTQPEKLDPHLLEGRNLGIKWGIRHTKGT